MAFCTKCGNEIADGAPFCSACGAPTAKPPTQMPPVPGPVYQQPVASPAPMPVAAYPAAASSGGNGAKIALFSLMGLLVIGIVVVLLLGFAVGPKWFVKNDAATSSDSTTTTDNSDGGTKDKDTAAIEKVANTFLDAISTADGEMLASVLPPSEIKEMIGLDPDEKIDDATYKLFCDSLSTGLVQAMEADGTKSVKFTGVKYSITVSGNTATAKVVGGEMTTTDVYGNKTTENAEEGNASEFTLVKEGGKWYVILDSVM
jgi:hypothetical protein